MNSEQNSSLTVLNTIFFGLLMGQVIFGVIAYVMLTENQYFSLSKDTAFFAVVCCVAVLGIYAGQFLFKKQLEKVHSAETLQKKINGYQTALIVKWALIEVLLYSHWLHFWLLITYYFLSFSYVWYHFSFSKNLQKKS